MTDGAYLPGIDTDHLLYEPVLYGGGEGSWQRDFFDALGRCGDSLTWDPAAVLSILSFGYACGERTLLGEIRRKPWLSRIGPQGQPQLLDIPPHDTIAESHERIAERLAALLREELVSVCRGFSKIYLQLSGGLDSRVVAGVLKGAADDGLIPTPIVAVTWGLPDSRDVAYGRAAAEVLGFEWMHIDLRPGHVLEVVEPAARGVACLVSPLHLHRMPWFENVEQDALVLAASYGDSIGRAEFSERHLLELNYLSPVDRLGLMKPAAYRLGWQVLTADLQAFRQRGRGRPPYALCEHEMQGHYMRGLIAQAMDIVNSYCTAYQAFTAPKVYAYMWSIHPALRTDRVYAILLERLDTRLARLPWARNNRALRGKTQGASRHLRHQFHEYQQWITGPLYEQLRSGVDVEWLERTGLFRADAIEALCERVRKPAATNLECESFLWLVGLRRFAQLVEESGKHVAPIGAEGASPASGPPVSSPPLTIGNRIRNVMKRSPLMVKLYYERYQPVRRYLLRRKALKAYPPRKPS